MRCPPCVFSFLFFIACNQRDPSVTKELADLRARIVKLEAGQSASLSAAKNPAPALRPVQQFPERYRPLMDKIGGGYTGIDSTLRERVLDIERMLSRRILDQDGKVEDPLATCAAIARRTLRQNSVEGARRALINSFGPMSGSAMLQLGQAGVK